jgi:DNA gyrase subunit A (EC 5.99.1.3)
MGRNARGVRGISLEENDRVISAQWVDSSQVILTTTANGYGKLTKVDEYRRTNGAGRALLPSRPTRVMVMWSARWR